MIRKSNKVLITLLFVVTVSVFSVFVQNNSAVIHKLNEDAGKNKLTSDSIVQKYKAQNLLTLDRVSEMVGITHEWSKGYTGKGISIAVVDSGVYPHPDLTTPENRIICFKDFVNGLSQPYDNFGHGTLISGIIAGNGYVSNGLYKGIAPDAQIVAVKVLNEAGESNSDNVIRGIEWVIENKDKYNIRIINLSFGVRVKSSQDQDKLSLAAERASQEGILVVTAVGNRVGESTPIYSPAANPHTLAVGTVDPRGSDAISQYKIAEFSSYWHSGNGSAKPDLVSLGMNIVSLETDMWYNPKLKKQMTKQVTYVEGNGTSESAAVISGIAAVLMEHYPQKTTAEIKDVLNSYCIKIDSNEILQGKGFVYIPK